MSDVFRIHVLPAQRGDALWIEYGDGGAPNHVLIDGGITATSRDQLRKRVEEVGTPLHFELLVVTHIDLDHIQGVLQFLDDLPVGITFGDIWFNGREQLKAVGLEPMGVEDGIRLAKILEREHRHTWNKAADGKAIALDANDNVVGHTLDGGMKITVLGPSLAQLERLRERWDDVIEAFGKADEPNHCDEETPGLYPEMPWLEPMGAIDVPALAETKFGEDDTVPNGSSIALSLEFAGRTALMLGDAYPSVVAKSLRAMAPTGHFRADVVKVPHHGSRNNMSRELASLLSSPTWIFSSNGAGNTKHPHKEAVARVLHYGHGVKTLVFNYHTSFNEDWDEDSLKNELGYETTYGNGDTPVTVDLC